jgi:predicted Fe-Mo cluster-binding NifX family protein
MSGPSGTVKGAKAKGCKIAFSSDGRTLDSKISRSLARAPYFIIAEGSPDNRTVIENPGKGKGSEGGEMAARALVKERVDTVVTSNIGPKAAKVLEDAHITVGMPRDDIRGHREMPRRQARGDARSELLGMPGEPWDGEGRPVSPQSLAFLQIS